MSKITVFLSEKGKYPFKKEIIDCLLIEKIKKVSDKTNASSLVAYVDIRKKKYTNINANNHNIMVEGIYKGNINSSEDLSKFVLNNKTYLINSVEVYNVGLPHIIISGD